ncbi:12667_t:CDS:1, partial [Funneliformis caledonium]
QKNIKLLQPNVENEQDEETSTTSAALGQTFNQNRQNNEETQKTTNNFTYFNALLSRKHRYTNCQILPVELPTIEHNDKAIENSEFDIEDDDNASNGTEQAD